VPWGRVSEGETRHDKEKQPPGLEGNSPGKRGGGGGGKDIWLRNGDSAKNFPVKR